MLDLVLRVFFRFLKNAFFKACRTALVEGSDSDVEVASDELSEELYLGVGPRPSYVSFLVLLLGRRCSAELVALLLGNVPSVSDQVVAELVALPLGDVCVFMI